MPTLSTAQRTKLAKFLGLLGSVHAGERDAAALAADRFLKSIGLTWRDALVAEPPKREPLHSTWRATCTELAKRPGDLRPWERKFVADLPQFPRVSTKQRYILAEIADRVLGRMAG